jgi:hypothetical protein
VWKSEKPIEIGEVGQPFGAVAKVRLGMTVDEAKKAAPSLTFSDDKNGPSARLFPKGASYNLKFDDGKVSEINVQLFKRGLDELTKKWGAGTPSVSGDGNHVRYINAEKTVRMDVYQVPSKDSFAIRWRAMRPLADVLGAGPDAKLVTGVKVLERPIADVVGDLDKLGYGCKQRDASDEADCDGLPEIEWSMGTSGRLTLRSKEGIVDTYNLHWVLDELPSAKQAVMDAYKKKWGEPTDDRGWIIFGRNPEIRVSPEKNGAPLTVSMHGLLSPPAPAAPAAPAAPPK